jgi:hypothetical protein
MRKSITFSKKSFFTPQYILSPRKALLFVLEEAIMVLLIVFQIYRFLGIKYVNYQISMFNEPIILQNILYLFASVCFFMIGYLTIALRDERVWLIHKNFHSMVFGTAKLKIQFSTKRKATLFFAEIIYAVIFAVSIFVYLDPDINVLPINTPKILNYLGFAIMLGVGLLLFSHTKDFRTLVYGPTPVQKRIQFGRHDLKRSTNKKTGSIRISLKSNPHKLKK